MKLAPSIERPAPLWPPDLVGTNRRGSISPAEFILADGTSFPGYCLRCYAPGCLHHPDGSDVCPVRAIHVGYSGATIDATCVGCGACVASCSFHVVGLDRATGGATVAPPGAHGDPREVTPELFTELAAGLSRQWGIAPTSLLEGRALIVRRLASLRKELFYPSVAAMFRAVGIPAAASNVGDTNNRIDLLLSDPQDTLAVEVKSYLESTDINIKSVQQALESKVVMDSRPGFPPSLRGSSTLVVGFNYPAARSNVLRLIDDIESAYGIRVGLVSVEKLAQAVLEVASGLPPTFDRPRLSALKGCL